MTNEFLDAMNSGEWEQLEGGLLGRLSHDNKYMVIDDTFTNGSEQTGFTFGYSPEEAQAVYWRKILEENELQLPELVRKASEVGLRAKNVRESLQTANAELFQEEQDAKFLVQVSESLLKTAAARLFSLLGDKNPGELVSVKEKEAPLEYDKNKAIEWCRENMNAAVVEELDVKAFESYSKVEELDFVTRGAKIPQGQIARKKLEDKVNV